MERNKKYELCNICKEVKRMNYKKGDIVKFKTMKGD